MSNILFKLQSGVNLSLKGCPYRKLYYYSYLRFSVCENEFSQIKKILLNSGENKENGMLV